jgi:hypothetical protein
MYVRLGLSELDMESAVDRTAATGPLVVFVVLAVVLVAGNRLPSIMYFFILGSGAATGVTGVTGATGAATTVGAPLFFPFGFPFIALIIYFYYILFIK